MVKGSDGRSLNHSTTIRNITNTVNSTANIRRGDRAIQFGRLSVEYISIAKLLCYVSPTLFLKTIRC